VAIAWPLAQPILSDKDGVAPLLAELPAEALFA
jgi:dTDP-4-dehydrorhamnose 3,5-epimerase-like enzyme